MRTALPQKRAAPVSGLFPAHVAAKVSRTEPSGAEGWTCRKCNNFNFADREFCNMRNCQAPGPWTCPQCGNRNFADRTFCNMKKCGAMRPGILHRAKGGANQEIVKSLLNQLLGGARGEALLASGMGSKGSSKGASKGSSHPEGSWVCLSCANVNYPSRTTCYAKTCGRPRAEVDGGPPPSNGPSGKQDYPAGSWVCSACQNVNFPSRDSCHKNGCGLPRSQADGGPPPSNSQSRGSNYPAGCWVCSACQNVNFPSRETCNKTGCGLPRAQYDNGPPQESGPPQAGTSNASNYPDGSWVCNQCQNVNFPSRDSCNRKGCGLPRSQCDAGPPQAGQEAAKKQETPVSGVDGAWTCAACGNVNWPSRTVCNKRTCQQPRTA